MGMSDIKDSSFMDKFDSLLSLTGWKYDEQIGLDTLQEKQAKSLYDELADFIMRHQK